ncbi:MAG: transglutaminase family protein [Deltaproteobacteria bacterium]|nr:transglutaminase family protein [Deltaproteobacteria bacterium]
MAYIISFGIIILSQNPVLHIPFDEKKFNKVNNTSQDSSEARKDQNFTPLDNSNTSSSGKNGTNTSTSELGILNSTIKMLSRKLSKVDKNLEKQTSDMMLDNKTDKWTPPRHPVGSIFSPDIYPWERIYVHDSVVLEKIPGGKYRLRTYNTQNNLRSVSLKTVTNPSLYKFFWGTYTIKTKSRYHILPSVSPGMIITGLEKGYIEKTTRFWKDGNDIYYIGPLKKLSKKPIILKLAADKYYFGNYHLRKTRLKTGPFFKNDQIIRSSVKKHLGNFTSRKQLVDFLYRYFHAFTVKPLKSIGNTLGVFEDIIKQKRGVCRHRSLLFMAIATSYGIKTRLVFNEIHAFVEIIDDNRKWVRIDLGGAIIPVNTVRKPDASAAYEYEIQSDSHIKSGSETTVKLKHKGSPPPHLTLVLKNSRQKIILTKTISPSISDKETTVIVKIPLLKPGKYKFEIAR